MLAWRYDSFFLSFLFLFLSFNRMWLRIDSLIVYSNFIRRGLSIFVSFICNWNIWINTSRLLFIFWYQLDGRIFETVSYMFVFCVLFLNAIKINHRFTYQIYKWLLLIDIYIYLISKPEYCWYVISYVVY